MQKPKIVCLGMNEESRIVVEELLKADANIVAIAGLPVAHSGTVSDYFDLQALAKQHHIEWIPVSDVNAENAKGALQATGADMLFVTGWSQLLKADAIGLFPNGVVGSHPTPLPYGRGRAPIPWTILQDERKSAVTLFQMSTGVDNGQILKQMPFDVPARANASAVYDIVASNLALGFVELYQDFTNNTVKRVVQDENQASWRSKRISQDGWIDFHKNASEIDRLVRAVSAPYPGAYSYLNGEKVIFWSATPAKGQDLRRFGMPGQILAKSQDMLLVQAGDDAIWLKFPEFPQEGEPTLQLGDRFGFHIEDELHALRSRVARLEALLSERETS